MTTDDIDANTQLKRDFESYLKGGEPSPLEFTSAPVLEKWRATLVHIKSEGDPLPIVLVLAGRVTGHPRIPDASIIHTSQVIWLDRNRNWVRTRNRIYRLGERADDEPANPT